MAESSKNTENNGISKEYPAMFVPVIILLVIIEIFFGFIITCKPQDIRSDALLSSIVWIAALIVFIYVFPQLKKFAFKSFSFERQINEVEENVDRLQKEINDLLILTVLDCFDYVTLSNLQTKNEVIFGLNSSAINTLIRLKNRGLIQEENPKSQFLTKIEQPDFLRDLREKKTQYQDIDYQIENDNMIINLKKFVTITEQGGKYLKLSEQFDKQLSDTANKYLKNGEQLKQQEQKS